MSERKRWLKVGLWAVLTRVRHAGRQTISTEDVLLLARRNEGLESLLRGFVDELKAKGRAR